MSIENNMEKPKTTGRMAELRKKLFVDKNYEKKELSPEMADLKFNLLAQIAGRREKALKGAKFYFNPNMVEDMGGEENIKKDYVAIAEKQIDLIPRLSKDKAGEKISKLASSIAFIKEKNLMTPKLEERVREEMNDIVSKAMANIETIIDFNLGDKQINLNAAAWLLVDLLKIVPTNHKLYKEISEKYYSVSLAIGEKDRALIEFDLNVFKQNELKGQIEKISGDGSRKLTFKEEEQIQALREKIMAIGAAIGASKGIIMQKEREVKKSIRSVGEKIKKAV